MMAKREKAEQENEKTQIPIRMSMALRVAIEKDAEKSGWSISEQIRYELLTIRGMWKHPYLPGQDTPVKA